MSRFSILTSSVNPLQISSHAAGALLLLAFSAGGSAAEVAEQPLTNKKKAQQNAAATLDATTLDTVHVVDKSADTMLPGELMPAYVGGQVARGGRVGLLGNKSVLDTPYSVISYTRELIQNQQATTLADIVENDSSIRNNNPRFGRFDQFSIRGFSLSNGEVALNGLFGLVPNYTVPLEGVERVEVLKGPNSLLNGMAPTGGVGGAINVIAKRATDAPITQVTANYASSSVLGGQVDIGRRFGSDNQFGIRLNSVYQDGKTAFSNDQKIERSLMTLGLDFRGENVRLSTDVWHYENRGTAPMERVTLNSRNGVLADVPDADKVTRNFAQRWSYANTIDTTVAVRGEYDFSPAITAYAAVGARRGRYDFLRVPVAVDSSGNFVTTTGNTTVNTSTVNRFLRHEDTVSGEAGVRTMFDTGVVHHTVNLNTSLYRIQFGNLESEIGTVASNIYNPVNGIEPAVIGMSNTPPRTAETDLSSVALSDTLSMLDDRLQITIGVRKQSVLNKTYLVTGAIRAKYDEDALTPTFAFTVKPLNHLALYGNYIESLTQTAMAPTNAANAGDIFPPAKTKQVEVGAKLDLGNFTSTLAFFRIERPSTFRDPATLVFGLNGEQHNTGVEWSVYGEPVSGVRVLGGVTLLDGELKKTIGGTNDGNTAPGVAKVNANIGMEWDVTAIPGFTWTARTIYTSDQYVDAANTREIPDWARLDLGARYRFVSGGKNVTLRATVDNVLDKHYWATVSTSDSVNGLTYGTPRMAFFSATVDF